MSTSYNEYMRKKRQRRIEGIQASVMELFALCLLFAGLGMVLVSIGVNQ